ncbi:DUF2971 domain-containing protein [Fibrobacter sp.]|uniref:DUF2971 domain-containing protein n=1 Tax=Fibrobacter sp. TaxID=35828 RepID=UPI00386BAD80
MLKYHNLQFTNASRLNDPFDCHPSLINFSNVPAGRCKIWPQDIVKLLESSPYKRNWEKAWICSLSKVNDALLMWSYYGNHKGVCIGIDMEKADKYLSRIWNGNSIGTQKLEVQYRDIVKKPDYFHDLDNGRFFNYQLSTKAKAWEHEKEVRLLLDDPNPGLIPCEFQPKTKCRKRNSDIKDLRFYPQIGRECFCSLYLGINMAQDKQDEILKVARWLNPEMKIYKMTVDPDAFRLKAQVLDLD